MLCEKISIVFSSHITSKTKSKSQYFLSFGSEVDVRQCVCVCCVILTSPFYRVLVKYSRSREAGRNQIWRETELIRSLT